MRTIGRLASSSAQETPLSFRAKRPARFSSVRALADRASRAERNLQLLQWWSLLRWQLSL
jgi:hypothetical protein